jgi:AraC-like DNA-binding protein
MKVLADPENIINPSIEPGLPASLQKEIASWASVQHFSHSSGDQLTQVFEAPEYSIFLIRLEALSGAQLSLVSESPTTALIYLSEAGEGVDFAGSAMTSFHEGDLAIITLPAGTHPILFHEGISSLFLVELRNSILKDLQLAFDSAKDFISGSRGLSKDYSSWETVKGDWRTWAAVRNMRECREKGGLLQLELKKGIMELLCLFAKTAQTKPATLRTGLVPNRDLYLRIRQHILKGPHIHQHSITELSKHFGLSPGILIRNFSLLFGMTPTRFVRMQALDKAWSLLSYTAIPIEEIALETGYTEVNNFYPAFKKKFGISPGDLRRRKSIP